MRFGDGGTVTGGIGTGVGGGDGRIGFAGGTGAGAGRFAGGVWFAAGRVFTGGTEEQATASNAVAINGAAIVCKTRCAIV